MAQNCPKEFRYLPLERSSQIRLLMLGGTHPFHETNWNQGSECKVVHFDLLDLPKFAALSYSWGNTAYSGQLCMSNGQTLPVSTTVLQAISELESFQPYQYLWIDQICINQHDIQERGQQVSLMAEIYSKAAEVFVWLGEDENELARKLKRIIDVYVPEQRPETHICISRADCAGLFSMHGGRSRVGYRSAFGPNEMSTVAKFLGRPWFRRAWVVQEVALAQTVTFLLGPHVFALADIGYLVSLTALTERETEDDALSTTKLRYSTGFECFHRITHQREQYHARMSYEGFLPFLCRIAGFCDVTDPRDLIYAFLGLYKRDHGLLVEPDYGISIETAFTKAAKAFIAQSNTLDLLSAITRTSDAAWNNPGISEHGCSDLPSWVPDWRWKLKNRPFRQGHNTPQFCASGTFLHRPSAGDTLGRLTVRGKVIASVQSLHNAIRPDHLAQGVLQNQLPLDDLYAELQKGRVRGSPPLTLERILRVVIADGSGRREFASNVEPSSKRLTERRIAKLVSTWEMMGQALTYENTAERVQEEARILQQHLKVAEGRCLITTTGVTALGLAPGHTMVGDAVCVLHGSRTPVVLRKLSRSVWRVVGQCFLERAMYGEAVTWGEEGADTFVLV